MPFFGFFRLDHSGTEEGHNATPDKHIPQLVEYVCNDKHIPQLVEYVCYIRIIINNFSCPSPVNLNISLSVFCTL